MYDFGLSLKDPRVEEQWAKLSETFRRQHRHVTSPGAQAWLGRPRTYLWLRDALRELSAKKAVESYWRFRTKPLAQTAGEAQTPSGTSEVAGQLRKSLSMVLGPGCDVVAGRNHLDGILAESSESRGDAAESAADAAANARREICHDLLMILDYYERPRFFFTDFAPRTFKELIGPKVYPDSERLASDPDALFKAAVRLGFTLWCFGPPALLNEKARGTYDLLSSHPEEFGLCMALAHGKKTPGSGRPTDSRDSPESQTQKMKVAKLRAYHAITSYLVFPDLAADKTKAKAFLKKEGWLGLVEGVGGCGALDDREARREALNLMTERMFLDTTKKALAKIISSEPDFKL
jgi:hypothetical protein